MQLYKREIYLKRIRGFVDDNQMIKVITGVRRCGKSSLMQTIADELLQKGINENNIIYLDLDARAYKNIKNANQLEILIESKSKVSGLKYLFIDEIQNVKNFEQLINSLRNDGDYSIFITGSNSYLLSGELVTKLTGRYVEFEIFPLNFYEYVEMKKFMQIEVKTDITSEFDEFLIYGGLPGALRYDNLNDKKTYIENIISEILEKDIRRRVKIRNISVFQKIQRFMINNFGSTVSLTSILNELSRNGLHIKRETLNRYIQILLDSKILYECNRFDLKSKRAIAGEKKYYLSDLGFYYSTNGDNRINYGPVLENVTFFYAKSNNYAVSVGRIGKLECDFICRKGYFDYSYIQVCMTMALSKETEDREYAPLESIHDNYPKYVLTRNDPIQKRDGVIHKNLPDMMQKGQLF